MMDVHEVVNLARAVGLDALYRLFNGVRHSHFSPLEYHGALNRFVKEALR